MLHLILVWNEWIKEETIFHRITPWRAVSAKLSLCWRWAKRMKMGLLLIVLLVLFDSYQCFYFIDDLDCVENTMSLTCDWEGPGYYSARNVYSKVERVIFDRFDESVFMLNNFPALNYFRYMTIFLIVNKSCKSLAH